MTDHQFWALVAIGIAQCILLARLLPKDVAQTPTPPCDAASPAFINHNPNLFIVRRVGDGHERTEELIRGMNETHNRQRVTNALHSGPDIGVEWNDGHIEWGVEKQEPKLDPVEIQAEDYPDGPF